MFDNLLLSECYANTAVSGKWLAGIECEKWGIVEESLPSTIAEVPAHCSKWTNFAM